MAEYIAREALGIGKCNPDVFEDKGYAKGWNAAIDIIQNAPTADVRPVARGKWEDVEVTYVADKTTLPFERISSMRCNQCNRYHTEIYYYGNPTEMAHFCPNCGAMMEES
jgi:hypothetical protein